MTDTAPIRIWIDPADTFTENTTFSTLIFGSMQSEYIRNDGHKDRKVNKTSAKLWAKLKREGWPRDRFQLLCANCNFGKLMNNGVCPHVG